MYEAEKKVKVQERKPSGDTELEVTEECVGTVREWLASQDLYRPKPILHAPAQDV